MLASHGKLSASDISKRFQVSPPAISQHLKVLRDAHVVTVEKKAQQRVYTINPRAIDEMDKWIHQLQKLWHDRFDRLDIVLKQLQIQNK